MMIFMVFVEEAIKNSSLTTLNPLILLNNDIDLGYYF